MLWYKQWNWLVEETPAWADNSLPGEDRWMNIFVRKLMNSSYLLAVIRNQQKSWKQGKKKPTQIFVSSYNIEEMLLNLLSERSLAGFHIEVHPP